jgi:hypothetical protein
MFGGVTPAKRRIFMWKASGNSAAGAASSSKLHNALVYFKQHWQLYLIFIMPAFLLTIIFRYIKSFFKFY